MSKKGLSFDEKKARMLQLFHEKNEFFQLKELEKIAPKEKGITANSVKEVVQALVDEGSVDTDKIAGSIYFWAFPSKLVNNKKRKLEDVQAKLEMATKKLKVIDRGLEEAKARTENTEDLTGLLKEVKDLEEIKEKLNCQLKTCEANNVQGLKLMRSEIQPVKEAANRWTDNIFAIKSWSKKKFMVEEKMLNKQFGIPEDLDYLE